MSRRIHLSCTVAVVLASTPIFAAAQSGDTCQSPVIAPAGVSINGDLNNMNSTSAIPAECTGATAAGADMFFSLAVTSGYHYDIQVKPSSTLNVAAAVWEDCALSAFPCIAGANNGGNYVTESLSLDPPADANYIIQVVGVDAVTGATTSKSKFTMKITETQIPVDGGPGDDSGADIAAPVESISDAVLADEGADAGVSTDDGPGADVNGRDQDMVDVGVPPPDEGGTNDTAGGADLDGRHDNGDGCGQGRTPAALAPLLLLIAVFVLRRNRINA